MRCTCEHQNTLMHKNLYKKKTPDKEMWMRFVVMQMHLVSLLVTGTHTALWVDRIHSSESEQHLFFIPHRNQIYYTNRSKQQAILKNNTFHRCVFLFLLRNIYVYIHQVIIFIKFVLNAACPSSWMRVRCDRIKNLVSIPTMKTTFFLSSFFFFVYPLWEYNDWLSLKSTDKRL